MEMGDGLRVTEPPLLSVSKALLGGVGLCCPVERTQATYVILNRLLAMFHKSKEGSEINFTNTFYLSK